VSEAVLIIAFSTHIAAPGGSRTALRPAPPTLAGAAQPVEPSVAFATVRSLNRCEIKEKLSIIDHVNDRALRPLDDAKAPAEPCIHKQEISMKSLYVPHHRALIGWTNPRFGASEVRDVVVVDVLDVVEDEALKATWMSHRLDHRHGAHRSDWMTLPDDEPVSGATSSLSAVRDAELLFDYLCHLGFEDEHAYVRVVHEFSLITGCRDAYGLAGDMACGRVSEAFEKRGGLAFLPSDEHVVRIPARPERRWDHS
jgi:hypothetical protein